MCDIYKIFPYTSFNRTSYTSSYVMRYVSIHRLSDYQILTVYLPFGWFWAAAFPSMGLEVICVLVCVMKYVRDSMCVWGGVIVSMGWKF